MKNLLLAFIVTLSGCAVTPAKLEIAGLERSESVRMTDLRPATEKQSEKFSLLVIADGFGIERLDDAALTPSPLRVLQHRAFETLGERDQTLDIKVHHLVVYQNLQSYLRATGLGGAIGGLVGAVVAHHMNNGPSFAGTSFPVSRTEFDATGVPEYKRAAIDGKETSVKGGLHAIYVETEIKGRRVFTKTFVPIKEGDAKLSLPAAVDEAINYHVSQHKSGAKTGS